jgi:hypothetical protein
MFERRFLRSIFGAVQDKGHGRRKWDFKLYQLHLAECIKIKTKVDRACDVI